MILFTPEECEYIKSFYFKDEEIDSKLAEGFSKGTIKFSNNSCKHVTSTDAELLLFLVERTSGIGVKSLEAVKFVRYTEGDYMGRHKDHSKYGADLLFKTFMIQLSDPYSYEGGNLIVENTVIDRTQGSVCTISSTDFHEVSKVTSGERFSLVLFLTENNLQLEKNLI